MFWNSPSGARVGALLILILLTGCTERAAPPSDPRLAWPITVTLTELPLALPGVGPDGALSAADVGRAGAFLDRYAVQRRGAITLIGGDLAPTATDRLFAEIALLAGERGVSPDRLKRGTGLGQPRLTVPHSAAEGPDCRAAAAQTGVWPFGCAHQRNLAAMIQDPLDLVAPESLDTPDVARLMIVLENYRKGDSTTSKRSDSERVSVSKISK